MVGALQRPGSGRHRPRIRHLPRQTADRLGGDAGDRRRPIRILRLAIPLAGQVGEDALETIAVARNKSLVVATLGNQRMRQGQHHRRIGIGPDRDPLGPRRVRPILANAADIDDPHPGFSERREGAAGAVPGAAAFGDLGVLRVGAAEHDEKPRMPRDRSP